MSFQQVIRMKNRHRIKKRWLKGQNIVEVAILFTLIVIAIFAMSKYVKRAVSGRLKENASEFSGSFYNPRGNTKIDTTLNLVENIYVNSLPTGKQENVDEVYGDTELEDEYLQRTWTERNENTTGNETTFLR
ncbi:MAG: hypothetical protein V1674_06590 [Candidatus Omnitrophota bacterium]